MSSLLKNKEVKEFERVRVLLYEIVCIQMSLMKIIPIDMKEYFSSNNNEKENPNKEIALSREYHVRDLEFDFENSSAKSAVCLNELIEGKNMLENHLILAGISSRSLRDFLESMIHLKNALEYDPYDIDIILGYIMISIMKRAHS